MLIIDTGIPDVIKITPKVFKDDRGFFLESFNQKVFAEKVGITPNFVQDNHSRSQQQNISMPITEQVYCLLQGQITPKQALEELMLRDMKSEYQQ